jgi:hypothetical protein
VAATIGTATAALVGATITGAAATAIGAGVLSAGVSLAQGKSLSDSLKGAVIGGVTSFIGAGIASEITGSIVEAAGGASASGLTASLAKVAGDMAGGAARGAIGAALTGQDPLDALLKGGLTAGLTSGVMEGVNSFTNEIPGFSDLKTDFGDMGAAAQRAISAGIASGILGKDSGDAVTQSLIGSFTQLAGTTFGNEIKDYSANVRGAYNDANSAGEALERNIDYQNRLAEDYNTRLEAAQEKQADLQEKYNRYLALSESGTEEGIQQANDLAEEINRVAPSLEEDKARLASIENQFGAAKEKYADLSNVFEQKKAAIPSAIEEFKAQEEANAVAVQKAIEHIAEVKGEAEETFGKELSSEDIVEIVKTGVSKEALDAAQEDLKGKDDKYKQSVIDRLTGKSGAEDSAVPNLTDADTSEATQINKLRSLGYTKEQIQSYLGTTEDLSKYFTEPVEPLPSAAKLEEPPTDVVDQLKNAGLKESENLPYLPTDDDFVPTNEIEKPEEKAPDVVDQLLNSEAPTIQDTTGLDEGPIIPVSGEPTLPAENQTPTGPGYYDEITGEFIPDENGGLQGPLGPETGNFDPNQEWEYSLTKPGVWTNKEGEEIDLSYMPDRDTAMTGKELMDRAGASPGAFRSGIRPPQGGGSGGAAPRPGGQPRPPVGGQPRPPTGGQPRPPAGGQPRPTSGGGGGAGAAAGILAGILGGGAGGVNAGDPRNPPASRNPAVDTIAGLAGQQQQNSMLNMMMNDKSEGAKIKSYKELFGEGLFGDTYVPPSARGYEPAQQPQFQSQDDDIEQFFRGGDVTDIDTLLQILRG